MTKMTKKTKVATVDTNFKESPVVKTYVVPVVVASDVPLVTTNEVPLVTTDEVPLVTTDEVPLVATNEVPLVAIDEVPVVATNEVPLVTTNEVPLVTTDEVPLVATDEVPLVATDEVPMVTIDDTSSVESNEEPNQKSPLSPIDIKPPHAYVRIIDHSKNLCELFEIKKICEFRHILKNITVATNRNDLIKNSSMTFDIDIEKGYIIIDNNSFRKIHPNLLKNLIEEFYADDFIISNFFNRVTDIIIAFYSAPNRYYIGLEIKADDVWHKLLATDIQNQTANDTTYNDYIDLYIVEGNIGIISAEDMDAINLINVHYALYKCIFPFNLQGVINYLDDYKNKLRIEKIKKYGKYLSIIPFALSIGAIYRYLVR